MRFKSSCVRFVSFFLALVFLSSMATAALLSVSMVFVASKVLCDVYGGFRAIVTAVAAVVFVIAGIKWTASENDPGARKAAKDAMVHAIVGMLIILTIIAVITLVMGASLC